MTNYANATPQEGDYVVVTATRYGQRDDDYTPLSGVPAQITALSWPFALLSLDSGKAGSSLDLRYMTIAKTTKQYHDKFWELNAAETPMQENTQQAVATCPNCGGKMRVFEQPNDMASFHCPDCGSSGVGHASN